MTDFLESYHLLGIAIGVSTFLIIGLFHPVVIKCHYYFGTGCRWWFVLLGVAGAALSIMTADVFWSSLAGVFAFSSFWTVKEIKDQQHRVDRGWFPANPRRKKEKVK